MRIVAVLMVMAVAFVVMRMTQYRHFFQQEEGQQAAEQAGEQRMRIGARLKGFRQRMQQRSR